MLQERTNRLALEHSPYLRQHAGNPVDWYPWGEQALIEAGSSDKPLIISIGYAACHWCHVMEKESFSDPDIAALMNEHFVCIKIDREERPDLDHTYMTAVQLIHQHGGWPLNVFALPDGRPFYGGTYFRPDQWKSLLMQISRLYRQERNTVVQQANEITQGVAMSGRIRLMEKEKPEMELRSVFAKLAKSLDYVHGGSLGAPKFPMPVQQAFLLRYFLYAGEEEARKALKMTLDRMAEGGIYDHLGGGFARYSVDKQWHIPHFEKMLYDNAQLISLYAEASRVLDNDLYRTVVKESIQFLEDQFQQAEGGFSSSLDADSEGDEGRYYVWTKGEIANILGDKASHFMDAYQIDGRSLWEEGKNVLWRHEDLASLAVAAGMELSAFEEEIRQARMTLLKTRSQRIPPALDDKVLLGWNAMMVIAYCDAWLALDEDQYLEKAVRLAHFLLNNMQHPKGGLFRVWKDGQAYTPACLEDYAWLIKALMLLYQGSLNEEWLMEADRLTHYVLQHFLDDGTGFFWLSDASVSLPAGPMMETYDNVIPSSNAVMMGNLHHLGRLLENDHYLNLALKGIRNMENHVDRHPSAYLYWAMLMLEMEAGLLTGVATGPDAAQISRGLLRRFDPWLLVAGAIKESAFPHISQRIDKQQTNIYICTDTVCLEPVNDLRKAESLILQSRTGLEKDSSEVGTAYS
ncbi:MAG TPA: thioredoxin domain-containing protein [Bacteroidales bacterium]|nr:thioredoxin domain-containing protein [Bacteroidales bacterium]